MAQSRTFVPLVRTDITSMAGIGPRWAVTHSLMLIVTTSMLKNVLNVSNLKMNYNVMDVKLIKKKFGSLRTTVSTNGKPGIVLAMLLKITLVVNFVIITIILNLITHKYFVLDV